MAWTEIARRKYRQDGLRYASDVTDAEWTLIEPLSPWPLGQWRESDLRAVDAILYMAPQWSPKAAIAEEVYALFDVGGLFFA